MKDSQQKKARTGLVKLVGLQRASGVVGDQSGKFMERAKEYVEDKNKAIKLIRRAATKAGKNKRHLRDIWKDFQLLLELAKTWVRGEYRAIPYRTLLSVFATIVYFAVPTDAIPDFLLGYGLIDDAAVIGFALKLVEKDLKQFQQWKKEKESSENK